MAYQTAFAAEEPSVEAVASLPGTTVLEFGASWCGHCIAAQRLVQPLLETRGDLRHLRIEDGRGKPLGRAYRVKLWPTLVLLRDGREVARLVRPQDAGEIERALAALDAG
ncbi:thioredoxin family protein [Luteimonas sp. RD2P54]|uniref:Thioredoxin family protein n=1 Tax=Luteimonas endophytica TaxID=3042023 RepID=A0ABT6J8E7_9GAMM|nr:thioredoxin family protein [Luteimonas endophytica]MDH5823090.1 thioredoxin family protein [Luteimonas endophytica]